MARHAQCAGHLVLVGALATACIAAALEFGGALHGRRSFSRVTRPARGLRPHSIEPVGSKRKGKRKFRGGTEWDDARLYDEWIKAGAPDEFDFRDMDDEIDLDNPPNSPLSLADEDLEADLADELLERSPAPSKGRADQPPDDGWEEAEAAYANAAISAGNMAVDRSGRRQGGREPRSRESAFETEEAAIEAAMRQLTSPSASSTSPSASMGFDGDDAIESWDADDFAPVDASALRAAKRQGGGDAFGPAKSAGGETAGSGLAQGPGGGGGSDLRRDSATSDSGATLDMLALADAEEGEGARTVDDSSGEKTQPFDMPGWVSDGPYAYRRDPDGAQAAPEGRSGSVPVPSSMRAHVLAAEAGELEPIKLWPETHWRAAWATAVDPVQSSCLRTTWANFNVKLPYNFPDVPDLAVDAYGVESETGEDLSIGDEAILKAQMAHAVTGLSSIADAGCVEVLANPNSRNAKRYIFRGKITERIDELILKLRPLSAPNRVVLYHSSVAFVNATHRILGDGMCTAALTVANSSLAVISRSAAYDNLLEKLAKDFALPFTGPNVERGGTGQVVLPSEQRAPGKELVGARMLRERVMRDAKVLDSGMLKVSSFINHQVDVSLIEACGEELALRLERSMPTKILTVEATGLIPAIFVARHLQVPVVFARKKRPLTISDAFTVSYRSATKGTLSELIVSEEYLSANDRILIIDDFLAGGSTAEALFKLIKMANAKVVGVGVLIEKLTDSGRAFLSGYEVPVESLVKVEGLDQGRIDVLDEPCFTVPGVTREEGPSAGDDVPAQSPSPADSTE